jgi:hypothetical protein
LQCSKGATTGWHRPTSDVWWRCWRPFCFVAEHPPTTEAYHWPQHKKCAAVCTSCLQDASFTPPHWQLEFPKLNQTSMPVIIDRVIYISYVTLIFLQIKDDLPLGAGVNPIKVWGKFGLFQFFPKIVKIPQNNNFCNQSCPVFSKLWMTAPRGRGSIL